MTKRSIALMTLAVPASILGLAACGSTEPGPVQPMGGPNAPGVLVLEPALRPYLDVPEGPQNYSRNEAGFLQYATRVRNKGAKAMTLSYTADFYDEQGVPVESKQPQTLFIDSQSEMPLHVVANSKDAKTMRVQIRAAK